MNRKSNPWVALIALILLLVLVVCTCTGCADEAAEVEAPRFIVENIDLDFGLAYIITDTETGVQYLFVKCVNEGGLTVMLDANGDPLIWEGEV